MSKLQIKDKNGNPIKIDGQNIEEVYSENETAIGTFLGNPLYRKVVISPFNCTPDNPATIKHGITNLDTVINHHEVFDNSSLQIPYINGSIYIALQKIDNENLYFNCSGTGSTGNTIYIILEYTKMTR